MVTAGVFLVVRCSPLFEYSQFALNIVAIIGMITAVPCYTALKVILKEFLSENKIVQSLTKSL